MYLCQGLKRDLQVAGLLLFCLCLFPLFIRQGTERACLYAHRLFQGRIAFTHIALERETRIRFLECIPRRTGGWAEGALIVLLAVDHVTVSPVTFCLGIFTGSYRHKYISEFVHDDHDPGTCGIDRAIPRYGMERGARYLTCPAAHTFAGIHLYFFNYFCFFSIAVHGDAPFYSFSFLALGSFRAVTSSPVRTPFVMRSSAT
jgi:hypothetical protein